jgi:signal peptidase I
VIAVPGDRVMVKLGKVFINGKQLDETYLPTSFVTNLESNGDWWLSQEGVEKTIAENNYLCLGDNRGRSRDGRAFGPIDRNLIVGKAFFKYWPITSIGLVPNISF